MDAVAWHVSNLLAEGSTLLNVLSVVFYVILGLAVFIIVVGICFCWLNKRADAEFDEQNTYRELEDGTTAPPSHARSSGSTCPGGTLPDKRVIKKTPSKPLPYRAKSTSSRPPQASTTAQL
ncbi:hypothetical protein H310_03416 [Aphanomyces invadans]|uniref:Uncharacterized protein n=1 Tax=Aphanomyces invadans TaxID=157072 RepID=A0A024UJ90_9STRA|nr:hypothetical protein H310_03416 [Aphanomyces invadans]ETW05698.1 hypothetical protein H310_03416 [Aphanomyces invadans]|eukprot:XP_008865475.1 hypothetical protein H310_03416 [Aphanomyces invadans]